MNDYPGPASGSGDEERVRRLLRDAVADVEPGESLDAIHARTTVTSFQRRRPWLLGAGAAVVATAATVAAVAMMGGNPGMPSADDPGFAGSPTPATSPTGDPAPTASSGPSVTPEPDSTATGSGEPATTTVPVYYVGETSRGPRLFREFHAVSASEGEAADAALGEAVAQQPRDDDYRTDWPAGTSARVGTDTGDDGVIPVVLRNDEVPLRRRPSSMTPEQAGLALEQLIYTAQAVTQTRAPVQFYLERPGATAVRTDMVLGRPTSEPLSQGDPLDVLAQVWVIDPAEGAEVTSPFEVSGVANAFEANVQWRLMQDDVLVDEGFTTAEEAMRMAPYSFTVKAPPGEYTLVVHDSDPSGGEGFAPWQDTKQITVVD